MRMKRFLSLMLVILMLTSLTISASTTVSEVYLYEEFDYDSKTAFETEYMWGLTTAEKTYTAGVSGAYAAADINAFRANGKTKLMHYYTQANYNGRVLSIENVNGDNAFQYGVKNSPSQQGSINFIPENVWAPTDGTEAYVISMDFKNIGYADGVTPPAVTEGTYVTEGGTTTYYDSEGNDITASITAVQTNVSSHYDAAGVYSETIYGKLWDLRSGITLTKTATDETSGTFKLSGFGGMRYWNDEGSGNFVLEKDVCYNIKNVLTYNDGTKLNFVQYVDGDGKRSGTLNVTDVSAYSLHPKTILSYQLYNVKMYSLSTAEGAFNVSAANTVNLPIDTTSITVKFSQPINESDLNTEAITITRNDEEFTNFEVGNVKTVIDDTTKEIYSTVDISFPYRLKASSSYNIILPETLKNTIGTTLGSNNVVSFNTMSAPTNTVTLSGNGGLDGSASAITSIIPGQHKFTATATESTGSSYLFVGIYDSENNLVSYTFSPAVQGDVLALASKVETGMKVKAFSCGNIFDLESFGSATPIE